MAGSSSTRGPIIRTRNGPFASRSQGQKGSWSSRRRRPMTSRPDGSRRTFTSNLRVGLAAGSPSTPRPSESSCKNGHRSLRGRPSPPSSNSFGVTFVACDYGPEISLATTVSTSSPMTSRPSTLSGDTNRPRYPRRLRFAMNGRRSTSSSDTHDERGTFGTCRRSSRGPSSRTRALTSRRPNG